MDKKFKIDDKLVTWKELIEEAKEFDEDFRLSPIKRTSEAANILRQNGYKVSYAKKKLK